MDLCRGNLECIKGDTMTFTLKLLEMLGAVTESISDA